MEDLYPEEMDCLFTMKGKILIFIRQNKYRDPPLTSEDIQNEFNIAANTVSEYLSDLERRQLIKREKDGKKKYITPTDFSDFFL